MKNKSLTYIFAAVAVLAVIGLIYLIMPKALPELAFLEAEAFVEEARVELEQGDVTVQKEDSTEVLVEEEVRLDTGDVVRVSDGSMATLYWPDGSLSRVKGPAEIVITEILVDSTNGDTDVQLNIQSGEVWTKVLDMLSEDSSITIKTQHTVAGIRGTETYHRVSDIIEVLRTYEHGVDVAVNGEKSVALVEGEELRYEEDKAEIKETEIEFDWIDNARDLDAIYRTNLEKKRIKMLEEYIAHEKDKQQTVARRQLGKEVTDSELMEIRLAQLDFSLATAKVLLAKGEKEQLETLLGTIQPLLEETRTLISNKGADLSEQFNKRLQLYQRLFFSTDTEDEFLNLRKQLVQTRASILPQQERRERLARMATRELFYAFDEVKKGRDRNAKEIFALLSIIQEDEKNFFEDAPAYRREILEKMVKKLDAIKEKDVDSLGDFKERYLGIAKPTLTEMEKLRNAIEDGDKEAVMQLFVKLSPEEQRALAAKYPMARKLLEEITPNEASEVMEDKVNSVDEMSPTDKELLEKKRLEEERQKLLEEQERLKLEEQERLKAEEEAKAAAKAEATAPKIYTGDPSGGTNTESNTTTEPVRHPLTTIPGTVG